MSSFDESGPITTENITQITPFLYLGDKRVAQDKEYLKEKGLTHIVNVTSEIRNYFENEAPFRYFQCPVADTEVAKLSPFFPGAVKFIQDAVEHGHHVLVHCRQGVSRSTTVIIAYLMKYQKLKFIEAYSQVRMKRAAARPNANFLHQLSVYEKAISMGTDGDSSANASTKRRAVAAPAVPSQAQKRAKAEAGPALPPGYVAPPASPSPKKPSDAAPSFPVPPEPAVLDSAFAPASAPPSVDSNPQRSPGDQPAAVAGSNSGPLVSLESAPADGQGGPAPAHVSGPAPSDVPGSTPPSSESTGRSNPEQS